MPNRFVPEIKDDSAGLVYVFTVVGTEGRISNLEQNLRLAGIIEENGDSSGSYVRFCPFRAYTAVREPDKAHIEFDIYSMSTRRKRIHDTFTQQFRRGLGELTTLMLQTGFKIEAKKHDELESKNKSPKLAF